MDVTDLLLSGFRYLGFAECVQCDTCGLVVKQWPDGSTVDNIHISSSPNCMFIQRKPGMEVRARLDTDFSRGLIELGFARPILAQVIADRLADVGDDFSTFTEYFLAVRNAEACLNPGHQNSMKTYYEKVGERSPYQRDANNSAEKNSALSAANIKCGKDCIICLTLKVDTVFMPCKHFSVCSSCAERFLICPMCRSHIDYCIKIQNDIP